MKKQILWAFIFLSVFGFYNQKLSAKPTITHLNGYAVVNVVTRRNILEMTPVVDVNPYDGKVDLRNINNFGSESFRVLFKKGKLTLATPEGEMSVNRSPLKKALSLPLKSDEFMSILLHKYSDKFCVQISDDKEVWTLHKNKKLKVEFQNFKNISQNPKKNEPFQYPFDIRITYKKNSFHLKWQKLYDYSYAHAR